MMIEKITPPPIQNIGPVTLPMPVINYLDNGIPVYEINMGSQEVVKIEIMVRSGRTNEHKHIVARATSRLIREGTREISSADLAEKIDFYGGTLSTPVNLDTASIVLYCLTKHFGQLIPLLADMLYNPSFPEKELQTFIETNQQRLLVDLTHNDVIAYRHITEQIYGAEHPYGYNSQAATYAALTRDDLVKHHREYYVPENMVIFISGRLNSKCMELLNQYIGQVRPGQAPAILIPAIPANLPSSVRIKNSGTVQSAIRIGRRLFPRTHPDHDGFYVLNTILGGYFGSRLMANIREDKGYTYSIHSSLDTMTYDGCWFISTEVSHESIEDALKQSYHEMAILQEKTVPPMELKMVRNYLLGTYLQMVDGPFNVADVIKTLVIDLVPLSSFEHIVETTRTITPTRLRELARQYLNKEDMWEVVVGDI